MDLITYIYYKLHQIRNWLNFGALCDRPLGIHATTKVYNLKNIEYDPTTGNVFRQPGGIYSAAAQIKIGSHTWIGPNVGIITQNHDLANPDIYSEPEPITIGTYCWIGMNAVILSGVVLGDHTIVGAGSIVTHSFQDGHCIIAGNPAKEIRRL